MKVSFSLVLAIIFATSLTSTAAVVVVASNGYFAPSLTKTVQNFPKSWGFNATASATVPTDATTTAYYLNLFEQPAHYAASVDTWATYATFATPACIAYRIFGEDTTVALTLSELGQMLTASAAVTLSTSPSTVTSSGWTLVLATNGPSRVPLVNALNAHGITDFTASSSSYPTSITGGAHVKWVADEAAVLSEVANNANHFGVLPLITFTEEGNHANMRCMNLRVVDPWDQTTVTAMPSLSAARDTSELSVKHVPGRIYVNSRSSSYPIIGALLIHVNRKLACVDRIMAGVIQAKNLLAENPPLTERTGFLPIPIDRQNRQLVALVNQTCPSHSAGAFDYVESTGSGVATRLLALWSREYLLRVSFPPFFFGYWCGGSHKAVAAVKSKSSYVASALSTEWTSADRAAYPTVRMIPFAAFSVSIVYNLPGVEALSLPLCAIGRIFNGKVTMWNDPELVAANPTIELPAQPIVVAARTARSGLTEAFTAAVENIEHKCPAAQRSGITKTHTWAYHVDAAGTSTSTVGKAVRKPYGIGFVAADDVGAIPYTSATLLNTTSGAETSANALDVKSAIASSSYDTNSQQVQLSIADGHYPFFRMLYTLFDEEQATEQRCAHLKRSLEFQRWALENGDLLAESNDYVALPDDLKQTALRLIANTKCNGRELFPVPYDLPLWVPIVAGGAFLILVVAAVWYLRKWTATRHAPKPGDDAFSCMFVVVQHAALLWEEYPEQMPAALRRFTQIVLAAVRRHNCHLSKRVADNFEIVSKKACSLAQCAAEIQSELAAVDWAHEIFFSGEDGAALLAEVKLKEDKKRKKAAIRRRQLRQQQRSSSNRPMADGSSRSTDDEDGESSEGSIPRLGNNSHHSQDSDMSDDHQHHQQQQQQQRSLDDTATPNDSRRGSVLTGAGSTVDSSLHTGDASTCTSSSSKMMPRFGTGPAVNGVEAIIVVSCGIRSGVKGVVVTAQDDDSKLEYSGPVVEQAAILVDKAHPGQIVCCSSTRDACFNGGDNNNNNNNNNKTSSSSSSSLDGAGEWVDVGKRTIQKKEVGLFLFSVHGVKLPKFNTQLRGDARNNNNDDDEADDDDGGGMLSQLRAQKTGIAKKRITVLIGVVAGIPAKTRAIDPETFSAAYQKLALGISSVVAKYKGHVHSFSCGKLTVTFNAVSPTPSHSSRAAQCAVELRDVCSRASTSFSFACGIASGHALCGAVFPNSVFDAKRQKQQQRQTNIKSGSSASYAASRSSAPVNPFMEGAVEMQDTSAPSSTASATSSSVQIDSTTATTTHAGNNNNNNNKNSKDTSNMHQDVVGQCFMAAEALSARAVANLKDKSNNHLLQLPAPLTEVETHSYFKIVDFVHLVDEAAFTLKPKRALIISLTSNKDDDDDDDDCEWHLRVGAASAKDENAAINNIMKTLHAHGSLCDKPQLKAAFEEVVQKDISDNNSKSEQQEELEEHEEEGSSSSDSAALSDPVLRKVKEILDYAGGVDAWFDAHLTYLSNNL